MEISSTILERALGGVNELALPVLAASCLLLMVRRRPELVIVRRPPRPGGLVRRGASLLGFALTIASPAVAAGRRHPQPAAPAPSVRTEPGRFPPPRLPGSSGPLEDPPWETTEVHPAVHRPSGDADASPERLFRRWGAAGGRDDEPERPDRARWHAVLPGETLWSIAADRLDTDDVRRIARYWPRIHRANRDEIGPNPNLIHAGQVLELPPEQA